MPDDFQKAHFEQFIWTLVDCDEAQGVPESLVPHGTQLFVIFSTTPSRDRWSRLHKTVRPITAIMNPWKRKEILRACVQHLTLRQSSHLEDCSASIDPLGRTNESRTNEIFDQLGPIPRLCIDYQINPMGMSLYEWDLDTAISEITPDKLESLVRRAPIADLGTDSVAHTIVLLRRESLDDVCSRGVVIPITPYIQSRLSNRFRNLERKEHLRLYRAFATVPEGRRMTGVFFEALAQTA